MAINICSLTAARTVSCSEPQFLRGGGGILHKAVFNYHYDCFALSPVLALTNYANDADFEYVPIGYARYWHGYLVPLKLLLLFFDYSDIRILNFFFQNFLLFMALREFYRNRLEQYVPGFLAAVFVLNPLTAALSLQFSTIYYIVLFSVISVLRLSAAGKLTEEKMNHVFFVTGIMTAYFDFLTNPLVPFGILLVLHFLLGNGEKAVVCVKTILQKGMLWAFGYCGMWGGKWLAGSILVRWNLFADAWNNVMIRSSLQSGSEGGAACFLAVYKNISVFMKWPFLIVFLLGMGYYMIRLHGMAREKLRSQAKTIRVFGLTALLPVGWILVLANHTAEHYWFTHKVFAVSVFALVSLGTYLTSDSEKVAGAR